jgi:hypothetical protein
LHEFCVANGTTAVVFFEFLSEVSIAAKSSEGRWDFLANLECARKATQLSTQPETSPPVIDFDTKHR